MCDADQVLGPNREILARERVFDGVKFSLERVRVHGGLEGDDGWRDVVRHPGAVCVVPVYEKRGWRGVVMIRNDRYAVGEWLWELPAGGIERGEVPAKCAARELREETGFKSKSVRALASFYTTPGMTDEMMHVFVAERLTRVGQRLEADERIVVEVVPVSEALDMAWNGAVRDGKTIAGLSLAWRSGVFGDVSWGPSIGRVPVRPDECGGGA